MNVATSIFLVAVFATFFNNALYWYTQITTYPLFAWVGKQEFVPFHKEYERRLLFLIYLPYTLLMVSNTLLFFIRPASMGVAWVAILFMLNLSIMAESLALAAPIHAQLDREGKHDGKIRRLVRYNVFRLAASTISSGMIAYLLARVLVA